MIEKPKRGQDIPFDPIQAKPCGNCGGTEFEWGIMPQTRYQPGMKVAGMTSSQMLKGRRCLQCGNVVGFSDDAFQKRAQQYSMRLALAIVVFTLGIVGLVMLIVALTVGFA